MPLVMGWMIEFMEIVYKKIILLDFFQEKKTSVYKANNEGLY